MFSVGALPSKVALDLLGSGERPELSLDSRPPLCHPPHQMPCSWEEVKVGNWIKQPSSGPDHNCERKRAQMCYKKTENISSSQLGSSMLGCCPETSGKPYPTILKINASKERIHSFESSLAKNFVILQNNLPKQHYATLPCLQSDPS